MSEIVFTGKFIVNGEHIVRELLEDAAKGLGYHPSKRITGNTEFLVVGDTGRFGKTRKIVAAEKRGVKLIDPQIFYDKL